MSRKTNLKTCKACGKETHMGDELKDGFICYTCKDSTTNLFVMCLYNDFFGYIKDPNKKGGFFNKESMDKLYKELKDNPEKYKHMFKR